MGLVVEAQYIHGHFVVEIVAESFETVLAKLELLDLLFLLMIECCHL